MQPEADFEVIGGSNNNSNIRAFSGTVAILGVTLDAEDMAVRALFPVKDVVPTVGPGGGSAVAEPTAYTPLGQPGVPVPAPLPQNPEAQVGQSGPIFQYVPPEE